LQIKEDDLSGPEIRAVLETQFAGMLTHVISEARERGYRRVSLETGLTEVSISALALYEADDILSILWRLCRRSVQPFHDLGDSTNLR
jgi:hypothetical protein